MDGIGNFLSRAIDRFKSSPHVLQTAALFYRTAITMKDITCAHIAKGVNSLLLFSPSMSKATLTGTMFAVVAHDMTDWLALETTPHLLCPPCRFGGSPSVLLHCPSSVPFRQSGRVQTSRGIHFAEECPGLVPIQSGHDAQTVTLNTPERFQASYPLLSLLPELHSPQS